MTDERDPAAARLQEIRERQLWGPERSNTWRNETDHDNIRWLLDQIQSAHARAATLEQQLRALTDQGLLGGTAGANAARACASSGGQ
jgi:predicted  nucleic acid-binding Zn-ribbon protein